MVVVIHRPARLRPSVTTPLEVIANDYGVTPCAPSASEETVAALAVRNAAAIATALAAAADSGAKVFRILPGWYPYGRSSGSGAVLPVTGFTDLTIILDGVELCRWVDEDIAYVRYDDLLFRSNGTIRVEGGTFSQYAPICSVGTVTATDADSWDVQLDDDHDGFDAVDYVIKYDPSIDGCTAHNALDAENDWVMEEIDAPTNTWRVHSDPANTFSAGAVIDVGDRVVVFRRKRAGHLFALQGCDDITFNDTRVTGCGNSVFAGQQLVDLTLNRLVMKPADRSRLIATAGGFMNLQFFRGTLRANGLDLEGTGDDGLNVHTRKWTDTFSDPYDPSDYDAGVTQTAADTITAKFTTSVTEARVEPLPQVGDRVRVVAPDFSAHALMIVADVDYTGSGTVTATVQFEDDLPGAFDDATWLVWNQSQTPKARVRDFSIRRGTARALLLLTDDATVDGVDAEGLRGGAIVARFPFSEGNSFICGFFGGHSYRNLNLINNGRYDALGGGRADIQLGFSYEPVSTIIPVPAEVTGVKPCIVEGASRGAGFGAIEISGTTVHADLIVSDTGALRAGSTTDPEDNDAYVASGKLLGSLRNANTAPRYSISANSLWRENDATPLVERGGLLWKLIGADMNSTADQALTKVGNFNNFIITGIRVANASISLTTAQGAIYTATGKGGNALMNASTAYTILTSAGLGLNVTLPNACLDERTTAALYLSLTTPQGAAATADFWVYGFPTS